MREADHMDHIQAEQLVARYGQTIYRLAYARTGSRMSSLFLLLHS